MTGGEVGDSPWRRLRSVWPVLFGLAVGLAVGVVYVRSGPLAHAESVRSLGGDAGSSFAAFRYFIHDAWHWPVLATDRMTSPSGEPVVIAFTDGLPLLALLAKATSWLGMDDETWIRLWYVGCLGASGAAAGLVACAAAMTRRSVIALLIVVATTSPVLLIRAVHPGLFAQFVLLLAWAVVFAFWRSGSARVMWWAVPVLVVSLLSHPYFLLMNLVLFVGVAVSSAVNGRWSRVELVRWGLGVTVALGASMFIFGFLSNDSVPAGGYGAFGMPLLSPVWPQWSGLIPGRSTFLTNSTGSIEGFNYVGFGGVVVLLIAGWSGRHRLRRWIREEQVLVAVLSILTVVAVSPVIYLASSTPWKPFGATVTEMTSGSGLVRLAGAAALGGVALVGMLAATRRLRVYATLLVSLAAIGVAIALVALVRRSVLLDLLGNFRSSGRLFWIVGIGLLCVAAVVLDRDAPAGAWIDGVAIALLAIQLVDVRHFVGESTDRLIAGEDRMETLAVLSSVMAAHEEVHLSTKWQCESSPESLRAFQDVVIAASLADRPIDGYYGGRTAAPVCPVPLTIAPEADVATVVLAGSPAGVEALASTDHDCREFDPFVVCSSDWSRVPAPTRRDFVSRST